MKYPKRLMEGGRIGFAAPSFGCNIEPYKTGFDSALAEFQRLGFSTVLGPNVYKGEGVGISNTPIECAKELSEMYISKDNDCIISCGGGELMCEILNHMDYENIAKADAKWFVGYSDNTNFTFILNTVFDTASIYANCAASFGILPWHQSLSDTFAILQNDNKVITVKGYESFEKESLKNADNPLSPLNLTEKKVIRKFIGNTEYPDSEIRMEGRLIGGCMDCLVNLLGTSFDKMAEFNERYREEGIIFFLESCDLNVYAIRRAIWQMDNAGWFKYAKGFIIGRPLVHGQEMFGLNQYEAVKGILGRYNLPIIMDADIGHIAPAMPVVSGSYLKCLADDNIEMEYHYI